MSFCTKGLPGVAESTVSKSEGKPSPWGEGAHVRADEGVRKVLFPNPHRLSSIVALSRRTRVILNDGFCDFAIRLRAE